MGIGRLSGSFLVAVGPIWPMHEELLEEVGGRQADALRVGVGAESPVAGASLRCVAAMADSPVPASNGHGAVARIMHDMVRHLRHAAAHCQNWGEL